MADVASFELAGFPQWLAQMLEIPSSNGKMLPIAEGMRNDTLASLAGSMRRRGMSEPAILAALAAENAQRCDPPLPDCEVGRIAASISRYEPANDPKLVLKTRRVADDGTPSDSFRVWRHDDLLAADFPEQRWVVKDLVPEASLVLLGGRKKLGKSWLALQMAQAVAGGQPFLQRPTSRGRVLFICLEDGERRLNRRLLKQNAVMGLPIRYVTGRFKPLDNGGLEALEKVLEEFTPVLAVIDTLAAAKTGRIDENAAGGMGDLANALRSMAQEHNVAIVVVAHHGKGTLGDPGHDLRGSSAVAAAADVNLGLYRTENVNTLKGEGRDLEPFELRIEFDSGETWRWQLVGDARQLARQETDDQLLQALESLGEADASAIASALGKHRTTVLPVLKRLELVGKISARTIREGHHSKILYSGKNSVSHTYTTPLTPPTCPTASARLDHRADAVDAVGRVGHICGVPPTPSSDVSGQTQ